MGDPSQNFYLAVYLIGIVVVVVVIVMLAIFLRSIGSTYADQRTFF
jgi:uncharacterized protein HemY